MQKTDWRRFDPLAQFAHALEAAFLPLPGRPRKREASSPALGD
ncbi:hypothetical protein [Methylacidimicrobium sp. B4]|nr:hypothetical protein [Methylacidimicrobium sp. B4]